MTTVSSIVISAGLVWDASYAAFSELGASRGNSLGAGIVEISSDQRDSTVFAVEAARPDHDATALNPPAGGALRASSPSSGGSACVKVNYVGTVPADIRLRVRLTEGGSYRNSALSRSILFSVDTGVSTASGGDAGCAAYTSQSYLYGAPPNSSYQLAGMPGDHDAGLAGWDAARPHSSRWYRLSWLLPADVTNAAQRQAVTAIFSWEAQST